jgi:2-C-methyl-D-erythritol 2,4-cyclodiphosphate synthase
LTTESRALRTGIGFDAHRLVEDRALVLGGIRITHARGLAGHSDGDVLLHAIADAVLGALALPDIGTRFPDTDPAHKDADSKVLLRDVLNEVGKARYRVVNLDCILVCDSPTIGPYSMAMRESIAELVGVPADAVGLQAKTTEGTRLAIENESIAAFATVLLTRSE